MCPLPRSWWPPTTTPTSTLQSSAPPCDCPCAFSSSPTCSGRAGSSTGSSSGLAPYRCPATGRHFLRCGPPYRLWVGATWSECSRRAPGSPIGERFHRSGGPPGWRHVPEYRSYRSEEHTSELQSRPHLVCRLLLEKKKR